MRVLHVTEAPGWGIFSLLREFTREQLHRGMDVHVLAAPRIGRLEGVAHHDWSLERKRPTTYPIGMREFARAVRGLRPDVVHVHSFYAGLLCRLPMLAGPVPIVYQPHAWAFNVVRLTAAKRMIETWERIASRRTDVLVANCADELAEGRQAGVRTPGLALGIALDTARFAPVDEPTRQHYRAQLSVRNPHLVLCVGRLARQKGQDQLVAAWEADPPPAAELVLVGISDPGSLRALAPTQWENTIRVIGDEHDVRPWLWAADLLVLPSRYEGSAVTVPEALACGRPVIATDVNGAREGVTDGPHPAAGAVVPLGDMDRLLAECRRRLADGRLAAEEGRVARERAVEMFETKTVVDRLDRAYRQACAGTARR